MALLMLTEISSFLCVFLCDEIISLSGQQMRISKNLIATKVHQLSAIQRYLIHVAILIIYVSIVMLQGQLRMNNNNRPITFCGAFTYLFFPDEHENNVMIFN